MMAIRHLRQNTKTNVIYYLNHRKIVYKPQANSGKHGIVVSGKWQIYYNKCNIREFVNKSLANSGKQGLFSILDFRNTKYYSVISKEIGQAYNNKGKRRSISFNCWKTRQVFSV